MAVPISKELLYTQVLGITRHECPPDHYRLLGLNQFEQDAEVIRQAIGQRTGQIQRALRGGDADAMIRHIHEVGNVLLSPHLKQAYDGMLLQQSMGASTGDAIRSASASQDDYQLRPSAPPVPAAYPARAPQFGQRPEPQAADPSEGTAPRTMPGKKKVASSAASKPVKRRSVIRVPIWVRVVVISGFIAAHGAIYWYAYDYINRPTEETVVTQAGIGDSGGARPEAPNTNKGATPLPRDTNRIKPPPASVTPSRGTSNDSQGNSSTPGILVRGGTSPKPTVSKPRNVATSSPGSELSAIPDTSVSPGMPTSNIPEPAPVVRKPFDTFEPYIGLPERTAATSTPEGAVVLGQIQGDAAAEVELELESSVVDLAGKLFRVASLPTGADTDQDRHWDVTVIDPGTGNVGGGSSVAHLLTDDEGHLKFHWDLEAEGSAADQLQNAMLLCSHSEDTHVMALRKPTFLPSVGMDLTSKKLESSVPLASPPLADSIRLEFTLAKASLSATAEPTNRIVPPSENMSFTIEDADSLVEGELLIASKQEADSQLSVTVVPRYRQSDSRKYAPLEHESLVQQIARLQRLLSKDAADLAAAHTNLPGHYANLQKLKATRPRNNDEAGAKARTALQIEGYIKKCESAIRAKTRTMPSSYDALNRIIAAARVARELHTKAEIEYRVFAETPSGPLVLAEAKRSEQLETGEDEFAFLDNTPGPAGIW